MGSELQVYTKQQKLQLWSERVKACRESGMSVADWCSANGISKYTYYEWQRKVFASANEAIQARFIELKEDTDNTSVVARIHRTGYNIEITSMEALMRLLTC